MRQAAQTLESAAEPGRGLTPVASMSRRDGTMREIRRAVVRGDLHPGERLTENALSTTLGVSRPTIREALAQLANEGLLTQEPYRGLHVSRLDASQILDIAKARHALDMLAVDAILDDAEGRRMNAVRASWAEFERWEFDADPLTRHEAHVAFHRSIWVASENSILLKYWPTTEAHLTIALAQDQSIRSDPDRASRVHHHLIDALESGDRQRIGNAFWEHTVQSAQELIAIIKKEEQE